MADHPTPSIATDPIPTLALRARDAAKAVGISPRLLATLTAERRIPFMRINTVVLYPIRDLQDWLSEQAGKEAGS